MSQNTADEVVFLAIRKKAAMVWFIMNSFGFWVLWQRGAELCVNLRHISWSGGAVPETLQSKEKGQKYFLKIGRMETRQSGKNNKQRPLPSIITAKMFCTLCFVTFRRSHDAFISRKCFPGTWCKWTPRDVRSHNSPDVKQVILTVSGLDSSTVASQKSLLCSGIQPFRHRSHNMARLPCAGVSMEINLPKNFKPLSVVF